ncbi:MAG: ABC transporter permease [Acidimicrobiia bacterium]
MSPRRRRRGVGALALAVVPLAFLGVFFVWPVGAILARGLWHRGSLDLHALSAVVDDPGLWHVARFTAWEALLSTGLTLLVGLPATAVLSRTRVPGRAALRALLVVPFVLPTIVVATAFRSLGIERSLGAILLAHCFFNVAVVVRVVGTTWESLDDRELEAARVLGAGPVRAWCAVTLPALRAAIAAAASIVFLFSFTSFGVILVLGGPRFATLETEIYRQTAELLDLRTAAVLSIVQLLAVVAALLVAAAMSGRAVVHTRARATGPPRGAQPRRRGRRGAMALAGLAPAVVLVAAPVLELVRRSLAHGADGYHRLDVTTPGFTDSPLHAIGTSILIACTATVLATSLGIALATAVTRRRRSRLARFGELVVVLPLGVSAVTVGFGFLIVFDAPPLDLRTSWWIIPIAHALVALPFVVRTAVPVLRAVDPHQRDAAAVLGASPARVWREIDLRAITRAAAVAAGFAFAISLGEFGATLFIVRPETTTVPVAIYRLLGRPGATNTDLAMALAVILMALTALAALAGDAVGVRRRWRV